MHNHDHNHSQITSAPNKAFVIGIFLNLGYVVVEAVIGISTNSLALLTDAGHNLGDVAGLAISLLAFRLAKVRSSESYTYGYKKTTILAALLNAVILLVTVGVLGFEAIRRLHDPVPVQGGTIAWVAALGIAINGISAFLFFRNKDKELNARGAYLHLAADAVVSLSVVIAGVLIFYTHAYWLDPVISLVVLIVILSSTWSLLTDSFRLSVDAVPKEIDHNKIIAVIKNTNGVEDVHHVHIWAMSTMENALTAHLVLKNDLSFAEKIKIITEVKHQLLHNNIHHATLEMDISEEDCKDVDC
ncbi:MAG: cation transporter [Chitinophagaceae bacterium]|nr:cation transporter [Chitinophagaceae bacterium]